MKSCSVFNPCRVLGILSNQQRHQRSLPGLASGHEKPQEVSSWMEACSYLHFAVSFWL